MPVLHLVDTSAWIFALRRSPNAAIKRRLLELLDADLVAGCGLVELELLGGAVNTQELESLRLQLAGLHYLTIESEDWRAAGMLAFLLRRNGITVPFTDVLLASVALRNHVSVVHADRDFDLIAANSDLQVESLVAHVHPR